MQRGKRFVVFDDFLSEADFSAARSLMARATFTKVTSVLAPTEDGPAFRSKVTRFGAELGSEDAGGRPKVYEQVARAVRAERDLYGDPGIDWDTIGFTFWKYPAGSRLGWHNDAGLGRRGEFILYLHDMWRPSWGGELMLLDEDPEPPGGEGGLSDNPVERMETLLGRSSTNPVAILPRPNRLVLVTAATIHTIRRVDQTAETHLRCTLTGFVSRDPQREESRQHAREKLGSLLSGLRP